MDCPFTRLSELLRKDRSMQPLTPPPPNPVPSINMEHARQLTTGRGEVTQDQIEYLAGLDYLLASLSCGKLALSDLDLDDVLIMYQAHVPVTHAAVDYLQENSIEVPDPSDSDTILLDSDDSDGDDDSDLSDD